MLSWIAKADIFGSTQYWTGPGRGTGHANHWDKDITKAAVVDEKEVLKWWYESGLERAKRGVTHYDITFIPSKGRVIVEVQL